MSRWWPTVDLAMIELFECLEQEFDFAYVIRFKANILVGYLGTAQEPASDWLTPTGRTRTSKRWNSRGSASLLNGSIVARSAA